MGLTSFSNFKLIRQSENFRIATATPITDEVNFMRTDWFAPSELAWLEKRNAKAPVRQSATALLLAKHLAAQVNEPANTIDHDNEGRPFFRQSLWTLSLSHKADLVMAAIAPNNFNVGIDVERYDAIQDLDLFIKYGLSQNEEGNLSEICNHWGVDDRQAVTALWCLKESLFKANCYSLTPKSIRILPFKHDRLTIEVLVQRKWQQLAPQDFQLEFYADHVLSAILF